MKLFDKILHLIEEEEIQISSHGYDELAEDDIFVRELLETFADGYVIKEYPDYYKGPCILVLQKDSKGGNVHSVWGIPKNSDTPAVLVTAYRPNSDLWTDDFKRRK